MRLELPLESRRTWMVAVVALIGACGWLLYLVLCDFLIGALIDERIRLTENSDPASFIIAPLRDDRVGVNPAMVEAASSYFPNSARLYLRLLQFETSKPEIGDLRPAEFHAIRATNLSPHDYRPHLQLALIEKYKADLSAAEQSARVALELAPNNPQAHYQLGTILWHRGAAAESFKEFRAAIAADPTFLPTVLYPLWNDAGENAGALEASIPDKPKEGLEQARFLLAHSRPDDFAAVFPQNDAEGSLGDPQRDLCLDSLIVAGHVNAP